MIMLIIRFFSQLLHSIGNVYIHIYTHIYPSWGPPVVASRSVSRAEEILLRHSQQYK